MSPNETSQSVTNTDIPTETAITVDPLTSPRDRDLVAETSPSPKYLKQLAMAMLLVSLFMNAQIDGRALAQEIPQNLESAIACLVATAESTSEQSQMIINCTDGRQAEVLLLNLPSHELPVPEHSSYASWTDAQVLGTIDTGYNCHTYTVREIQDRFGIKLIGEEKVWLETGIDQILEVLGEEVMTIDTLDITAADLATQMSSLETPDDASLYAITYTNSEGRIIHSNFVTGIDSNGNFRVEHKLGQDGVFEHTIHQTLNFYFLNEGGVMNIYKLSALTLPEISGINQGVPTSTDQQPYLPRTIEDSRFVQQLSSHP